MGTQPGYDEIVISEVMVDDSDFPGWRT